MLYFAYGSNMPTEQIRCSDPYATFEGVAELRSYKLDFTRCSSRWKAGVADVVPSAGCTVWGVLWEVSKPGFEKLDIREGAPKHYQQEDAVVSRCGIEVKCVIYTVVCKEGPFLPSSKYMKRLIDGACEHNLPADYVTQLREIPIAEEG